MINNSEHIDEIKKKLNNVVKKEELINSLNGIFIAVSFSLLVFVFFLFVESIGNFNSGFRTIMVLLLTVITALLFAVYSVFPILKAYGYFRKTDYLKTAFQVGHRFTDIKDELLNSLQLITKENKYNSSPVLINKAFESIYEKIKPVDFTSIVDFSKSKKYFRTTASIIITSGILLFIPFLQNAAGRLINYDKEFIIPPRFSFNI